MSRSEYKRPLTLKYTTMLQCEENMAFFACDIEETLEALEASLSRSEYKRAVIALHGLMNNIQRNPSDKRFRWGTLCVIV